MITPSEPTATDGDRWLLLIHQLPAKPAYFRVKIWRRLRTLGAVAVKNAVYALPENAESREDFEWLLREIEEGGGEAMICEARLVDGLTDQEVRRLFDRDRDADYEAVAEEARAIAAALGADASRERRSESRSQLIGLRHRLQQIVAIDFFGANGRETVDGLLAGLEAALAEPMPQGAVEPGSPRRELTGFHSRLWVTRQGVQVDRIASAWLIRRFIDAEARFKFVPGKDYQPAPNELRFDMFEAEFTHEGDRCTFEVLVDRGGLSGDSALAAIAEIVHDIDLKDGKYDRPEAAGMATLLAGIAAGAPGDDARLARGAAVFDDLYNYFRSRRRGEKG